MRKVLLIEDERAIADVVEVALERAGLAVTVCARMTEARSLLQRAAGAERFELVILDLGLPDGDGIELCRELRRASDLPVVILTCRDGEVDRVLGLELGADDYVTKPFSPRELAARVKTVLRRAGAGAAGGALRALRLGRVEIVPEGFTATLDGAPVPLTPTEFAILRALAESPAMVFSRAALIDRVRGAGTYLTERTVDSHVRGIRRKFARVDPAADPVETVFGVGYRGRALR